MGCLSRVPEFYTDNKKNRLPPKFNLILCRRSDLYVGGKIFNKLPASIRIEQSAAKLRIDLKKIVDSHGNIRIPFKASDFMPVRLQQNITQLDVAGHMAECLFKLSFLGMNLSIFNNI